MQEDPNWDGGYTCTGSNGYEPSECDSSDTGPLTCSGTSIAPEGTNTLDFTITLTQSLTSTHYVTKSSSTLSSTDMMTSWTPSSTTTSGPWPTGTGTPASSLSTPTGAASSSSGFRLKHVAAALIVGGLLPVIFG
jgi:hypothetical protein